MRLTVAELLTATGGRLAQGLDAADIWGVSTDSRTIEPGEVFFALSGPNFDGHDFLKDAVVKGAVGAVVDREGFKAPGSFNIIVVKDTLRALGDLAGFVRQHNTAKVVAISGSSGKTTTKEMITAILEAQEPKGEVLKTRGNLNNLIGLPLTLLGLKSEHRAAVVELGINVPGEMQRLAEICSPDVALITNIGRAHLEGLGTIEGVTKEKGALFGALDTDGVMIVNLDDPHVCKVANARDNSRITYSTTQKEADVYVKDITSQSLMATDVLYDVMGKPVEVRINAPGLCNVTNGAAAMATGVALGVNTEDMARGLNAFTPFDHRLKVVEINGITIIDDTYNANPDSMGEALRTLAATGAEGTTRRIAVLGDMLEMGPDSAKLHNEVGALANTLGVDLVITVGELAEHTAKGAIKSGMGADKVFSFTDITEALELLRTKLTPNDTVLVKGSRAVGLERIIDGLNETSLN